MKNFSLRYLPQTNFGRISQKILVNQETHIHFLIQHMDKYLICLYLNQILDMLSEESELFCKQEMKYH